MSDQLPVEKLVAAYRKLRAAIAEEEELFEAKIAGLKEKLDYVSKTLLDFCNEQNVDSVTPDIRRASTANCWNCRAFGLVT